MSAFLWSIVPHINLGDAGGYQAAGGVASVQAHVRSACEDPSRVRNFAKRITTLPGMALSARPFLSTNWRSSFASVRSTALMTVTMETKRHTDENHKPRPYRCPLGWIIVLARGSRILIEPWKPCCNATSITVVMSSGFFSGYQLSPTTMWTFRIMCLYTCSSKQIYHNNSNNRISPHRKKVILAI